MANVFVSLMQGLGHDIDTFGDSTGAFDLGFPGGVASGGA
jgi:hypothetical protein